MTAYWTLRSRAARALLAGGMLLFAACSDPAGEHPSTGPIDAEIHEILRLEDELERVRRLAEFFQQTPPESVDQVVAGYERSFLDQGDIELVLLAEWWTRFDPKGAVKWAQADWRADRHPRIKYAIIRRVARADPSLAIELFQTDLGIDMQMFNALLQGLIVGWYESGKPGLLDFIQDQPSLERVQQSWATLARLVVLDKGVEPAISWAEELGPQLNVDSQRYLYQRIAGAVAQKDPERAATWATPLIHQGYSENLLRRVSRHWGRRDPVGSLTWLSQFESTSLQKQSVGDVFIFWYIREREVAESWLMDQGDDLGTWLAPAVARLTRFKAEIAAKKPGEDADWEGLLDLAMRIEDYEDRWYAVTHVGMNWLEKTGDGETVDAWMKAHDAPQLYIDKVHKRR
ncbi:MAG: hypothetical protein JRF61_03435 [Deltaproteobacteria bacterium]|nr:hypothetical protein [Deltaproteobacteria bacterium]